MLYTPRRDVNEIRWRSGQETSLVPPCSNLRSLEANVLLEKVLATLLGHFGAPRSDSASPWSFGAWGIGPPLPLVTPLTPRDEN